MPLSCHGPLIFGDTTCLKASESSNPRIRACQYLSVGNEYSLIRGGRRHSSRYTHQRARNRQRALFWIISTAPDKRGLDVAVCRERAGLKPLGSLASSSECISRLTYGNPAGTRPVGWGTQIPIPWLVCNANQGTPPVPVAQEP